MRNENIIDLDYLPLWPLVVVIEDCYVPELTAQIYRTLRDCSDEFLEVMITGKAVIAERDTHQRQN